MSVESEWKDLTAAQAAGHRGMLMVEQVGASGTVKQQRKGIPTDIMPLMSVDDQNR